jgi:acyl-CoA synthetase (AMP-forming)/AMP-acid ligase II
MTQAGGRMNDGLNHEFSSFCNKSGINFFIMYGQTEATARMSYLPAEYSLAKLGSMGIAIPGGRFYLIDDNGEEIIKDGVVGELVYEGKNVSMGYAISGEDLIKGDENNGVLITGDLAKRDAEGFYYIVGRKKRFIKLFGNRINLDETERLIKSLTPNVACTGIDDKMVIYITDEELISKVKYFVVEKTKINQKAFKVALIDSIPKNTSGKTIYSELPKI